MSGQQIGTLFGYPVVELDDVPSPIAPVSEASKERFRELWREMHALPAPIDELGCKLAARLLLAGRARQIVIPSTDEMCGVYLLERDDELPNRRR